MRSLGLDIGDKRTGVAISDPGGILATPLTVLTAEDEGVLVDEVLKLAERHEAGRIVVGLPRRLDGESGAQAGKATAFVDRLSWRAKQSHLGQVDIQLWDERLSTRAAQRVKMEASGRGSKLSRRTGRGAPKRRSSIKAEVDAIAAALILQGFLDSRRPEEWPGP
ncbi:MAG: Holliday junction resolvase RuvX [Dehalococcoidia bacterium]